MAKLGRFQRVAAVVCSCSSQGEIHIRLLSLAPAAEAKGPYRLPAEMLPADLHAPETPLWASTSAETGEILWLWRRSENAGE
jgi:hypothetical protein